MSSVVFSLFVRAGLTFEFIFAYVNYCWWGDDVRSEIIDHCYWWGDKRCNSPYDSNSRDTTGSVSRPL